MALYSSINKLDLHTPHTRDRAISLVIVAASLFSVFNSTDNICIHPYRYLGQTVHENDYFQTNM